MTDPKQSVSESESENEIKSESEEVNNFYQDQTVVNVEYKSTYTATDFANDWAQDSL